MARTFINIYYYHALNFTAIDKVISNGISVKLLDNLGGAMNLIEYFVEKNTAQITIELTVDEVNQRIQNAYQEVNLQTTLPGFRKGKAPLNVLKNRIHLPELQEDILKKIVKEATNYFLQEKKEEDIIDLPYLKSIDSIQENHSFQIKLFADLYPKIIPADLENKVFDLNVPFTEDSIIQDKINALLETHAIYSDLEKPEASSYAIIEQAITDSNDISSVKSPKTQMIELAEDNIQPGLSKKMMKLNVGDHEFYPIPKEEAESEKFIYIKIIGWKKKELPVFNQDFLDSIQANKQVDEYRDELKKEAEEEYKKKVHGTTIETVLDYLVVNSSFEVIPDNYYLQYQETELEDFKRDIKKMNLTWEKYLEISKQTEEGFIKQMEPNLTKQIKLDLLFRYYALNHHELAPSEEETKHETQKLVENVRNAGENISYEKLESYVFQNLTKGNIMNWLAKNAKTSIKQT